MPESFTRYLDVNRAAYDELSSEYVARSHAYAIRDLLLLGPLFAYLTRAFNGEEISILDIGPGSGLNMKICHENGFTVTGIDLSPKIVANLGHSLPYARLLLGDFVTTPLSTTFHGIISKASLHLFPKSDGLRYLQKIMTLLRPNGMAYISVTAAEVSGEGFCSKPDYPGEVIRFKRTWTRPELLTSLADVGLRVELENLEEEPSRRKRWINVYAVKPLVGADDVKEF